MNLFTVDFQSSSLHKLTTVNVLCPANAKRDSGLSTLMLLHGMTDDQTGWLRRSLAENYAEKLGICLIIPNADLSFYTNMAYGGDYLAFLAEELPDFLENYFPVTKEKKGHFVAGNSMGGYGSFLLAMRYPERYRAAFSLSGPMKIAWIHRILSDRELTDLSVRGDRDECDRKIRQIVSMENIPELLVTSLLESGDMVRIFQGMFGSASSNLEGSDVDLFELVKRKAFVENPADLYAYCGRQDYHYESNLLFDKMVAGMDIRYSLRTGDGGHEWDYWNRQVPDIFENIKKYCQNDECL